MNLEVLCYLGLLKFSERLDALIALLPGPSKAEATALLQKLKVVPKAELLQRWAKLRDEEYIAMRQELYDKTRVSLDEVSPAVRVWCVSWLADQHE